MIGLQASWLASVGTVVPGRAARLIRALYVQGLRKVAWLLLFAIVAGYIGISIGRYWRDAREAGRNVRETGRLSIDYLHVPVVPARVFPKTGDPLRVCNGSRTAVLVGRHGGTAYVLLRPGKDGDPPAEIVPLVDSDYAVAAVSERPQACNPQAP